MRAKIMLLNGNAQGRTLTGCASDILTDIAISFEHTLVMRDEKISEESTQSYGAEFTVEAGEACGECDAVLLGENECGGLDELLETLMLPARVREYKIPDGFSDAAVLKSRETPRGCVIQARRTGSDTVNFCARAAAQTAKERECVLQYVTMGGANGKIWRDAIERAALENGITTRDYSPEEAVAAMIAHPAQFRVLLCPPTAGAIIMAAADELCGVKRLLFDRYIGDEKPFVYAPVTSGAPQKGDTVNPLGMASACASMLRYSLALTKEADCVDAAVQNVLQAGWRTPDMTFDDKAHVGTQAIMRLLSEQIELAGQFLNHR